MLDSLSSKATDRLHLAFRPKTRSAYASMFVAFCIYTKASIVNVNVKVVLSFLECLVVNSCSYCMVANYVSAIKANFVLFDLPFSVLDHPQIKYFLKALKINRPLKIKSHNIITISWLIEISKAYEGFTSGSIYKMAILLGFFCLFKAFKLAPPPPPLPMHWQVLNRLDILLGMMSFSPKIMLRF